jgi:hypothetical protein
MKQRIIIDAWAQPAMKDAVPVEAASLYRRSKSPSYHETGVSPEQMVEMMDQAGVEKVMLSAMSRPGSWIVSNEDVARFVQQFPDRFVGVAAINLEKPLEAVHQLRHTVKDLGFKAVRVLPWLWQRPPNDKFYFPIYVACIELDIPFCTQVGHTGSLLPSEPGRPIPYLDEVAVTFPELAIVAGHIGTPWVDEMISVAWKHKRVYIDTSAHLPQRYPQQLIHYIRTYGQDKVLFGTNFPQFSFGKCIGQLSSLELPEVVLQKFLSENACRVFKLS